MMYVITAEPKDQFITSRHETRGERGLLRSYVSYILYEEGATACPLCHHCTNHSTTYHVYTFMSVTVLTIVLLFIYTHLCL